MSQKVTLLTTEQSPKTAMNNCSINYTCTFTALSRYLLQNCILRTIFLWVLLWTPRRTPFWPPDLFLFFRLTMSIHFQFGKKKDMANNLMLITLWIISQAQNILTYWHAETKQNAMLVVVVVPYRTDCDMQHSRVCVCVWDRREHAPSLQSTSFTQVIMWTSA